MGGRGNCCRCIRIRRRGKDCATSGAGPPLSSASAPVGVRELSIALSHSHVQHGRSLHGNLCCIQLARRSFCRSPWGVWGQPARDGASKFLWVCGACPSPGCFPVAGWRLGAPLAITNDDEGRGGVPLGRLVRATRLSDCLVNVVNRHDYSKTRILFKRNPSAPGLLARRCVDIIHRLHHHSD
jgi:hypothetical protein